MQRSVPISTAQRAFNVIDLEHDIADALRPQMRERTPDEFAPPALRLPAYVAHLEGVSEVGKLSAEAVVKEYEAAAKEVEAMGAEMQQAAKKCEEMTAGVHAMIAEINDTAQRYRDEGKKIFEQIEACALMTADVRATCDALKQKIAVQ